MRSINNIKKIFDEVYEFLLEECGSDSVFMKGVTERYKVRDGMSYTDFMEMMDVYFSINNEKFNGSIDLNKPSTKVHAYKYIQQVDKFQRITDAICKGYNQLKRQGNDEGVNTVIDQFDEFDRVMIVNKSNHIASS